MKPAYKDKLKSSLSNTPTVIVGGIAVELNTRIKRDKSDLDLILTNTTPEILEKIEQLRFTLETNIDTYTLDRVCGCLDLRDEELQDKTIKKIPNKYGELKILGPEGLIFTKLTSLHVSGEKYQSTVYGIKILRDKDLNDISNLHNLNINKELLLHLIDNDAHLQSELYNSQQFLNDSLKIILNTSLPLETRRNAYGIAKTANLFRDKKVLDELIEMGNKTDTIIFAHELASSTTYKTLLNKYEDINPLKR